MYQAQEQFAALNKANLEAATRFANVALLSAERLLDVQLKAAKTALADGIDSAKTLAEVKDLQQLAEVKDTVAQPAFEKAADYVKSVYEIASETQAEFGKLIEQQVAGGKIAALFAQHDAALEIADDLIFQFQIVPQHFRDIRADFQRFPLIHHGQTFQEQDARDQPVGMRLLFPHLMTEMIGQFSQTPLPAHAPMDEVLVDGGQFARQQPVEFGNDFGVALHG